MTSSSRIHDDKNRQSYDVSSRLEDYSSCRFEHGLSAADLLNHTAIINALRDRCNSGRNPHVE